MSEFSTVKLANGTMEFIPSHLVYLNPKSEGSTQCLYLVWPFKANEPVALNEAMNYKTKTPLYGYFTDHPDLYKMGRHNITLDYAHFNELSDDYFDMTNRLLGKIESLTSTDEIWSYAFCICDSRGTKVPIGVSPSFERVGAHE